MKKAVITGATGALGRALIKICIQSGYDVIAVIHRDSKRAYEISKIEHCKALYLNLDEYKKAMDEVEKQGIDITDCELFFHLAWMAPFGQDRDNLTLQLDNINYAVDAVNFAKALGCSAFIGTGSQAEYGRVEGLLSPKTPAFPETGYGIAKLCAGQMTRLACEQIGMRHIWTRVLSVYGPHDREQTLISTAISKMMKNEDTEFTACNQMWDYIYSEDAARAIFLTAQKGTSGSVYVIGSGKVRPLKDFIQIIASITGYKKEIGFGKRNYNNKQVMYLKADIGALKEMGFNQQWEFEKGITEIIENIYFSN